jgi:hypothetical protein
MVTARSAIQATELRGQPGVQESAVTVMLVPNEEQEWYLLCISVAIVGLRTTTDSLAYIDNPVCHTEMRVNNNT